MKPTDRSESPNPPENPAVPTPPAPDVGSPGTELEFAL